MKVVTKDFPFPKTWGLTLKTNLYVKTNIYNVQNQSYNFNPWSHPWPPTAPPSCSWTLGWAEAHGNGSKWFPIPINLGFYTKNKSLACSEPKLKFHSLKWSLASYSTSILFLTSRLSSGSWKGSQNPKWFAMPKKYWVWHHNQVSSMFRTKVTISLLEVLLGLLQHLHPVLDIQVNLDSWRWSPMIFHIQKPVFSH